MAGITLYRIHARLFTLLPKRPVQLLALPVSTEVICNIDPAKIHSIKSKNDFSRQHSWNIVIIAIPVFNGCHKTFFCTLREYRIVVFTLLRNIRIAFHITSRKSPRSGGIRYSVIGANIFNIFINFIFKVHFSSCELFTFYKTDRKLKFKTQISFHTCNRMQFILVIGIKTLLV